MSIMQTEAKPPRDQAIVETAIDIFLRYGFKKTSMDDLAKAAGLSRQGLYLHFQDKEAVFRAVIAVIAERTLATARTALLRDDLGLEDLLLNAFERMAESALAQLNPATLQELFDTAHGLVGEVVRNLDEQLIDLLAAAFKRHLAGRRAGRPSPRALAEHLYVVSYGYRHRGVRGADYAARMRSAVRIICGP
jgi:AcrR family transcriptional regulator